MTTKTFTIKAEDLITLTKAAKLLDVSHATVYRWVEARKLAVVHVNNRMFIDRKQVEDLKKRRDQDGFMVFTVRRKIKTRSHKSNYGNKA